MRDLPYVMRRYGKNVMVLTGQYSAQKSGALQSVIDIIEEFDFQLFFQAGIQSNPKTKMINEVAEICKINQIDLILAIGGGSVIDSAKAVSAIAVMSQTDVWTYFTTTRSIDASIPVIAIPTTIGTGSEMNGGTVITNESLEKKQGFGDVCLQPRAAFYNPKFIMSMPFENIACACADIMSHIFDSGYFSNCSVMPMLKGIQTEVLKSVIDNSKDLIRNRDSVQAIEGLMWASSWGLNGFMYENLKMDPSIHIIEHQLSASYDIHHGRGIAIIMPRWLRYIISDETAGQIAEFGCACFNVENEADKVKMAHRTVDQLEEYLYQDLKLASDLGSISVGLDDLRELADKTLQGSVIDGYVQLDTNQVYDILSLCI